VAASTHPQFFPYDLKPAIRQALFLFAAVACFFTIANSQPVSIQTNEKQIIIDGVYDSVVISFDKEIIIKGQAKGTLCFGCDTVIEGKVIEDAATVGGSVIQKDGATIGGDLIIIGGKYLHDNEPALRGNESETVVIAGYEEEFRRWAQNPAAVFAPEFSFSFISMRTLAVLFWFIVSLVGATIAPGAVSRAAARFQLSALKVVGIGFLGFLALFIILVTTASIGLVPDYVGILAGGMALVLLFLAYVYGRITLHAVAGKFLSKRIFSGSRHSEALSLLIGSFFCTLLTSLPYIWAFSIFIMLIISVGLLLTGVSRNSWVKTEKV